MIGFRSCAMKTKVIWIVECEHVRISLVLKGFSELPGILGLQGGNRGGLGRSGLTLRKDLGAGKVDISLVLTVFSKRVFFFHKISSVFDVMGFKWISNKNKKIILVMGGKSMHIHLF